MADGELTLKLDDDTLRSLAAAAEAAGMAVEVYAAQVVATHAARDVDDWGEDIRILEEAERTGEWYTAEEVMAEFDRAVEARLAPKR